MAIARVSTATGSNYAGSFATTIATAAQAHATGNSLVVAVRWFNSGGSSSISGVADSAGNAYSRAAGRLSAGNDQVDVWYAVNITGHVANVITATISVSSQYRGICAVEYSGVATSSALDTTATGVGTGGTLTSGSFTTTQADELLFAAAEVGNTGRTWTAGTGYSIAVQDASQVLVTEDQVVSSIQTGVTAGFTCNDTNNSKCIVVATFKAAVAAGGQPTALRSSLNLTGARRIGRGF